MGRIADTISELGVFFTKGDRRSLKAKKNIAASFIIKGLSIAISLYIVPLTLHYLNITTYGIWQTLSSVIGWMVLFDVGLGHGLRNNLSVALAKNDRSLAKIYISTTYAILVIIVSSVFVLFILVFPFLNWGQLLNAPIEYNEELSTLVFFTFSFFCLQFVFKLIGTVLLADQSPAKSNLLNLASQFLSLIVIFILTRTTEGSILYLGFTVTLAPVIILVLANFLLFNTTYKQLRPSFKSINFKYAPILMNLGFKFFIIQIAGIVLFATDNLIISHVLGPEEVTPYSLAFKYFSVPKILFIIVMAPFWSAFTEAWVKDEVKWIKNIVNKLTKIWGLVVVAVLFMLLVSEYIYDFWLGKEVNIPFQLSLYMGLFVVIQSFNDIFVYFINGVGKLRIQVYTGIIAIVLNIPMSIFFAKNLGMGSSGVIIATIISTILSLVLHSIQYRKIVNKRATGIWNQ